MSFRLANEVELRLQNAWEYVLRDYFIIYISSQECVLERLLLTGEDILLTTIDFLDEVALIDPNDGPPVDGALIADIDLDGRLDYVRSISVQLLE